MFIMDDGIRLNIKLDRPAGADGTQASPRDFNNQASPRDLNNERCPLVIVIHGFTGHMEERHILAVCEAMHAIGIATLRVDMYGHGKSDGRFEDHTLYKWLSSQSSGLSFSRAFTASRP